MDELVRHAVEVTVDLDVVVDADPARFPLGQDVATGRQRPERRPVELGAPGQGRAALKSLGIRDYARHCETDVGQTPVFIGGARKFNTAPSDQKF